MKAFDMFDEDNPMCLNCIYMYWCEDCEDWHCEKLIQGEECEPIAERKEE